MDKIAAPTPEQLKKQETLKQYFENKIGKDIYTVVGKDHFKIQNLSNFLL